MSSTALDFQMVEQVEEARSKSLEILSKSMISMGMKNKLKRRRSISSSNTAGMKFVNQSKRRLSSSSRVFGRRVETLKELIPNSQECLGVDALFRETADHILALQLKVQVMKTVIDLLSNSGSGY